MKDAHLYDPAHIQALESENRKVWQDPEAILKRLEIKPDYVVADLGCGSGFFTVPLSRKVKKVYGIDIQQEMLKFLEQKIHKQKIGNITTLLSTNDTIPLETESIDLLITVNTLHEFQNKTKTVKEIRRVLKADAQAVVIDFKKEDTKNGPPVAIRVSQSVAEDLFGKHGFFVVDTHPLQYHYLLVFRKK